ncbi:hypothetical protein V6N13_141092 [Hibiscus sabdariffa]
MMLLTLFPVSLPIGLVKRESEKEYWWLTALRFWRLTRADWLVPQGVKEPRNPFQKAHLSTTSITWHWCRVQICTVCTSSFQIKES